MKSTRNIKLLAIIVPVLAICSRSIAAELGYETSISNFGDPLESGFYQGSGSTGDVPDYGASSWTHLITSRHSNTSNNYQLQIGSIFTSNDRLFFRKIAASGTSNPGWHEVATRSSNTFSGTQTMNGVFRMQRVGTPSFPNGLVQDSQSLHAYVDDYAVWFISEQDENAGGSGSINFVIDDDGTANPAFGIYRKSPSSSPIFQAQANGNIGIGRSNPENALDVNGTIRAKEVIVETGWADYVFDEDYALPSLAEVKSHIQEHRRLPGVPSAEEVAENGVSVGDSQRILLQKIEELTLHQIRQEEFLQAQAERIAALEKENARLQASR